MIATKLFPSGAWEVSDIIGEHRVHRTYYGYRKREALRLFRAEFPVTRRPRPGAR